MIGLTYEIPILDDLTSILPTRGLTEKLWKTDVSVAYALFV